MGSGRMVGNLSPIRKLCFSEHLRQRDNVARSALRSPRSVRTHSLPAAPATRLGASWILPRTSCAKEGHHCLNRGSAAGGGHESLIPRHVMQADEYGIHPMARCREIPSEGILDRLSHTHDGMELHFAEQEVDLDAFAAQCRFNWNVRTPEAIDIETRGLLSVTRHRS